MDYYRHDGGAWTNYAHNKQKKKRSEGGSGGKNNPIAARRARREQRRKRVEVAVEAELEEAKE
jgi:hypothetical protein